MIYHVAHRIFQDPRPIEKSIAFNEAEGRLRDIEEVQQVYFGNDGIFLVAVDEDQIIGTGAIRRLDHEEDVAMELVL